jgi:hypothetical protein
MTHIGRRSSFSKEQQSLVFDKNTADDLASFRGLVVDMCNFSNPTTKFIPGKSFPNGVTFIVMPYFNCCIYAVSWKGDIGELRGTKGGTDENIKGREVTITAKDRSDASIYDAEIALDSQRRLQEENSSVPGYKSLSFFSNVYTDYESQLKNNKVNRSGSGEIPFNFSKG